MKKDKANFQKEFESRLNALKKGVEQQKTAATGDKKEAQKAELEALSDALRKGQDLISNFYQAKYKRGLDELQAKFSSAPKPAFSFTFSNQMKPASNTVTKTNTAQDEEVVQKTDWTIHDLQGKKFEHTCDGKHISVNELKDCTVKIPNETPSV